MPAPGHQLPNSEIRSGSWCLRARLILSYAGDDAELKVLAAELVADASGHGQVMAAMELKKRHFASYSVMKSRAPDGKARR